jgi:hypothetical protein
MHLSKATEFVLQRVNLVAEEMAQVVERWLSNHKALSSNPSTKKKVNFDVYTLKNLRTE